MDRPRLLATLVCCAVANVVFAQQPDPDAAILRDTPRYEHTGPPAFRFERPDAEWRFVDIERQRAALAGRLSAREIEDRFRGLLARLFHQGLRITISVYVLPEPGTSTPAGKALLEEVVSRVAGRREARLREARLIALARRPAAWVRYEIPGAQEPHERWMGVQIECPDPSSRQRVVIFVEAPRSRWKAARADLKKVLRSWRWR